MELSANRQQQALQGAGRRWVVGITGASGSIYGLRLIEELLQNGYEVHLVVSDAGWRVLKEECGWLVSRRQEAVDNWLGTRTFPGKLQLHASADIGASIASGSFRAEGMVVAPCSMGTLAHIASGTSDSLLTRAADVTLKEARQLIIVPRETPLHAIHLENMLQLARLGARIVPAMPAFYYQPETIADMVNFQVGKLLDCMGIDHRLFRRWGE